MVNEIIRKTTKVITILLAIFGAVILTTIVHEQIHKIDFKEVINPNDNQICYFDSWTFRGYYHFSYGVDEMEKANLIAKYTELKAYTVSIIMLMVLGYCIYNGWKKKEDWWNTDKL